MFVCDAGDSLGEDQRSLFLIGEVLRLPPCRQHREAIDTLTGSHGVARAAPVSVPSPEWTKQLTIV